MHEIIVFSVVFVVVMIVELFVGIALTLIGVKEDIQSLVDKISGWTILAGLLCLFGFGMKLLFWG